MRLNPRASLLIERFNSPLEYMTTSEVPSSLQDSTRVFQTQEVQDQDKSVKDGY